MTRLRTTLDALERALNGLAGAKGRKSVILVSEGFIHDINVDEFKRVNEASRRANAAIYFLNARGLEGMPIAMTAQFGPALPDQDVGFALTESWDAVAGSEVVASESGGFTVRNTNDLSGGIQKIANETQAYYLLGYIPSNTARDGRFRKIQVKLANGKGLQVRARKGYYAPSDTGKSAMAPKKGVDPVIQSALDSPWAEDAIPLRMTHYIGDEKTLGKAAVLVTTEVDIRALEFEEKDGRSLADLQFLLVVAHRESGEFFRYDQGVSMKLQPATRERLQPLLVPDRAGLRAQERGLPGQDRGARHAHGAGGHRHPRVRRPAPGRAAGLDPGAERHARAVPGRRGGSRRDARRRSPGGSSARAPTCCASSRSTGRRRTRRRACPA